MNRKALSVAGMVVMMRGRLLALFITEKVLRDVRLIPPQMTGVFVFVEVIAHLLL